MPASLKSPVKLMQDEIMNNESSAVSDNYSLEFQRFIDMAAHDLEAPLRKLGVLTDRLISKYANKQDEETEQYSSRIHSCIAEMRSLIDGLTELAGAIPENMKDEPCEIGTIIKMIWHESASLVKEKQAEISTGIIPVLQGDSSQFRLLFKNIIENSFKFSKPGIPLRIEITAEELTMEEKKHFILPQNSSYHRIKVADNGIGFEPGDIKRIFQPLVRLHGKSAFRGSGLGLAVVKRIADNHGGKVYAESTPGMGASIILIVPQNNH